MRTRMTRLLTAVFALTVLSASVVACATPDNSDPKTLTVGFVVDPSWAQVPVAEREGFFDKHGVKVKVVAFPSGVEALQALAAHQLDVTTAADVPVAATLTRSPSLRVIGDGSRWQGSRIVARRSAGITSTASLAGHSIGTPLGTSAAYYASNALSDSKIDAKLTQVAPQAMVTAATQHNVDAVSIFQPYQAQVIDALGDDAVELSGGTYNQHSLYLAGETATERKSEALRAFLAALADAGAELTARSAPAISAVADATQLAPELLGKILPEFDYTMQLPADLPNTLTTLANWGKDQGSIERTTELPDYGQLMDNAYLPPAQ